MIRTPKRGRILLADDDLAFRLSTAELLRQDGYEVVPVASGQDAVEALQRESFDLLLLDLRMPGTDGLVVVEALRRWGEGIPILMISGYGTVDSTVRALHLGADDFLTKPVEPDVLSARVTELLERRPNIAVNENPGLGAIVGRSASMQVIFDAVHRVASTDATVLVTGETGTGKELVARAIHDHSPRASQPFVAVNCAALAEGLLESELFGHVRGAFTGAIADKRGLFEEAAGGTLFLDEIGDVSPTLQQRLLRAIQEREVRRVGASRSIGVDVRIIVATSRDLRADVATGRFREDLFYRLNVFAIELPPLRERRADIPLLVEAALEQARAGPGAKPRLSCSPFAMRMLRDYDWPGNVRELFAVVRGAAIRADGDRIEAQHLPAEQRGVASGEGERYQSGKDEEDEHAAILAALGEAQGNRVRAAEMLGMSRTTLWRKMKSFGIE